MTNRNRGLTLTATEKKSMRVVYSAITPSCKGGDYLALKRSGEEAYRATFIFR